MEWKHTQLEPPPRGFSRFDTWEKKIGFFKMEIFARTLTDGTALDFLLTLSLCGVLDTVIAQTTASTFENAHLELLCMYKETLKAMPKPEEFI